MRGKLVEHTHKIFTGHVGDGVFDAVATAVQAVQIAAERAFPEKVSERVSLDFVMAVKAISFESEFFLKRDFHERVVGKQWLVVRYKLKVKIKKCESSEFNLYSLYNILC